MTDTVPLHLPRIRAQRCLALTPISSLIAGVPYCSRAMGHTGRHAATIGARRVVIAVWVS